jgi:cytochrome b
MTAIPSHRAAPAMPDRITVWDLPTRIFHWALAACLLVSWFTGEDEGAGLVHRLSGEVIAGLVVFRVIWGFVGGEHARFADFVRGPRAAAGHLGHLLRGRAEPSVGHNPLGGLSVLLLLASVSFVVVTGLFSAGDEGPGGPVAGWFGSDLSGLHEPAFRILQGVVALHLLGVLVTSLVSRDNLVAAMIIGSKRRRPADLAAPARRGSTLALLLAVVLAALTSAYLVSLPPTNARGAEAQDRRAGLATESQQHGRPDRQDDQDEARPNP